MSATRPTRSHNRFALRLFVALAGGFLCALLAQPARAQSEPITSTLFIPLLPAGNVPGSTIFLPVVTGSEAPPPPQAEPVFGVNGRVEPNPAGGEQFVTPNGLTFGLVGATPAIDAELARLARRTAPPRVRLWGTLYRSTDTDSAFIVVTQIVVDEEITPTPTPRISPSPTATRPPPTPTRTVTPTRGPTPTPRPSISPTPTPTADTAQPVAVGRFESVNLRAVPGAGDARSGSVRRGQECDIVGRSADGAWLKLDCPGGAGWIEPHLVTTSGNLGALPEITPEPTPTPTATSAPTATPTATPYVFRGWRMLIYSNAQLQGVPLVARDEPSINFNWGTGAPQAGLPADFFSIAFDRTIDVEPGFYFITAQADDGMRVYLDGRLIVDQWFGPAGKRIRLGRPLAGQHELRVEYVEISGEAQVYFAFEKAPPPLRWTATYSNLADATGSDPFVQREADGGQYQLDYDWGAGSPVVAPAEGWTGRWEGEFFFDGGNYQFYANAKDGVRLYLDGILVLDRSIAGSGELRNDFVGIGLGQHTVTVEYFNTTGDAWLRVWWVRDPRGRIPE